MHRMGCTCTRAAMCATQVARRARAGTLGMQRAQRLHMGVHRTKQATSTAVSMRSSTAVTSVRGRQRWAPLQASKSFSPFVDQFSVTVGGEPAAHIAARVRLEGPNSIIGRAVVLHADTDSCMPPSGMAGARLASCVIGIAANRALTGAGESNGGERVWQRARASPLGSLQTPSGRAVASLEEGPRCTTDLEGRLGAGGCDARGATLGTFWFTDEGGGNVLVEAAVRGLDPASKYGLAIRECG